MPYFTIIIPCLNEQECLPRLLQNINQQTFKDFEVIVVDGNSTDKTPKLVQSFKAKYPLTLITTKKRNVSHQRNLGAAKAKGSVLIFFDADTQIPKNYFDKVHQAFEQKKPHFLTTYIRVDSRKPGDQIFAAFTNLTFEMGRILKTPLCYGAMMAIKRTVFEDIGGFDPKTSFGEDSQLFQTAIDANYKYIVLPTPHFVFSLRRWRREGTLDTVYQYIRLNLSVMINGYHGEHPKYEMGGDAAKSSLAHQDFARRFDNLFRQTRKASHDQTSSMKEFFNRLFPEN